MAKLNELSEEHKALLLGVYVSKSAEVTVRQLVPMFTTKPTALSSQLRALGSLGLINLSWTIIERCYSDCTRTERCRSYSLTKEGRALACKLVRVANAA